MRKHAGRQQNPPSAARCANSRITVEIFSVHPHAYAWRFSGGFCVCPHACAWRFSGGSGDCPHAYQAAEKVFRMPERARIGGSKMYPRGSANAFSASNCVAIFSRRSWRTFSQPVTHGGRGGFCDCPHAASVPPNSTYSQRSAWIGSTRVARLAGTYPAASATHAIPIVARIIVVKSFG
jgi:hypothetical protein